MNVRDGVYVLFETLHQTFHVISEDGWLNELLHYPNEGSNTCSDPSRNEDDNHCATLCSYGDTGRNGDVTGSYEFLLIWYGIHDPSHPGSRPRCLFPPFNDPSEFTVGVALHYFAEKSKFLICKLQLQRRPKCRDYFSFDRCLYL